MRARCAASVLLVALGTATAVAVTGAHADDPAQPVTVTVTTTVDRTVDGWPAAWWAARSRSWHRRFVQADRNSRARGRTVRRLRRAQTRTWRPTLRSAVRLASAVTGVPAWQLSKVAYCESTDDPFADNGSHFGYWQLSWDPFGLSPFDPYAAALSTAMTVKRDGGWRQWAASRPCHGLR